MIYRDYIQQTGTSADAWGTSKLMTLPIAQKIVEHNSDFSIVSTTEINSSVTRTTLANGYMKLYIDNGYTSGNSMSGNGFTIKLVDDSDTVLLTKYVVSGNSYESLTLAIHINCYITDNGNCIYHFGNYNDASDGFDFALVTLKNDANDIEYTGCVYYIGTIYEMDDGGNVLVGTALTNTRTHIQQGYLFINNAELINGNSEFIGKHVKYAYEVVSDGGLVSNGLYTINDETYMCANSLLWKV